MSKDWRTILRFAVMGLVITAVFVAYQVLTDSSPPPPPNISLILMFMVLCPPSFLTIPLIDVEIGSEGFYPLWSIVALMNAVLYAVIGAAYVGLRKKREGPAAG
ncbi:MAG: hypothetical protein WBB89_07340 [Candidatus Acidiferrum sp.]